MRTQWGHLRGLYRPSNETISVVKKTLILVGFMSSYGRIRNVCGNPIPYGNPYATVVMIAAAYYVTVVMIAAAYYVTVEVILKSEVVGTLEQRQD